MLLRLQVRTVLAGSSFPTTHRRDVLQSFSSLPHNLPLVPFGTRRIASLFLIDSPCFLLCLASKMDPPGVNNQQNQQQRNRGEKSVVGCFLVVHTSRQPNFAHLSLLLSHSAS